MSPTPPPADRTAAGRDLALGLALLIAAGAVGFWVAGRPAVPPARPAVGATWLEETVPVPAGGVVRRLRVPQPTTLEIAVDPVGGGAVHVTFGPPRAPGASPDEPDPSAARTWDVRAGDAPRREFVFAPGLYVVRLEPAPGAGPASARLRVRSTGAPASAPGTGS